MKFIKRNDTIRGSAALNNIIDTASKFQTDKIMSLSVQHYLPENKSGHVGLKNQHDVPV